MPVSPLLRGSMKLLLGLLIAKICSADDEPSYLWTKCKGDPSTGIHGKQLMIDDVFEIEKIKMDVYKGNVRMWIKKYNCFEVFGYYYASPNVNDILICVLFFRLLFF